MLLTITMKGKNTQELGYLLHKNPYRPQCFELNFGKAYVFYTEISDNRTTAALLLDINPIDFARGKKGSRDGGLFDYVNDRPYAASSFMSSAISNVFSTAMSGKCTKRQELADMPLDLEAVVHMLPIRGEESLVYEIFEPLGYEVSIEKSVLDEKFPEWGESCYIDLTIKGRVRLCGLLNHLYTLIPVMDKQKHYYISEDEIDKLIKHGEGWLDSHPAKNKIIRRYFDMRKSYANRLINRLIDDETVSEGSMSENEETTGNADDTNKKIPLNTLRLEAVKNAVLNSGAESVIDIGCGECRLTSMLLPEKQIKNITAADVCVRVLERAKERLNYDRMMPYRKNKLTLMQASLLYRDKRFKGFDAACVIEVIEHIDIQRIPALERVLFEYAVPHTVILTTPNKEYNVNYAAMENGELRHTDHRFEWTREEFKNWCEQVCEKFGYRVEISYIGDVDEKYGSPTQMGVFTKCE